MCFAHGMPVCSGARDLRAQSAPGFPCALSSREGQCIRIARTKSCREKEHPCLHVIASEAKQSSFPRCEGKLDCLVAEPVIGRAFARPVGSRNDDFSPSCTAARRTASLPLAYVPGIHVLLHGPANDVDGGGAHRPRQTATAP